MHLTYQTGIATLIQLTAMTLLNVANAVNSSVTQCRANSADCLGDIILALLYFMVLTFWFGFIWLLGAAAQDKRSKRMAQVLITAELLVIAVALVNAQRYNDLLGLVTSLVDMTLAAWVCYLAFRLMRSGGARVTASSRTRRRRLND